MEEHDWLFDVLAELSLHSEEIGFAVLAEALTLCMDAFELDERRMREANKRPQLIPVQRPQVLRYEDRFAIVSPVKVQTGPLSTGLIDGIRRRSRAA